VEDYFRMLTLVQTITVKNCMFSRSSSSYNNEQSGIFIFCFESLCATCAYRLPQMLNADWSVRLIVLLLR